MGFLPHLESIVYMTIFTYFNPEYKFKSKLHPYHQPHMNFFIIQFCIKKKKPLKSLKRK